MSRDGTTRRGGLSPDEVGRVESACDRFEAAARGGRRVRIDDALGDADGPLRSAMLRELIVLERLYRRKDGERPGTDLLPADARAADDDAVIFTGAGVGEYTTGPAAADARRLIAEMGRDSKYVAGLCRGVEVLSSAGVLRDQRAAAGQYIERDSMNRSGAREWVQAKAEPVVVSGRIVTVGH